MLGHQPFYHKSIKSAIVAFGSIFQDLTLSRDKGDGTTQDIDVPIRYVSQDRGDARRRDDIDTQPTFWQTVPRLSFWLPDAPAYAGEFNLNKLASAPTSEGRLYSPASYRLPIEANLVTKHEEDMFQLLEQIMPFFRPSYTVSVYTPAGSPLDIPFTLESSSVELDAEGGSEDLKRQILATLNFDAIIQMYGPVHTAHVIDLVEIDVGYDNLQGDYVNDHTITVDENS